jgi:hypothetical protein
LLLLPDAPGWGVEELVYLGLETGELGFVLMLLLGDAVWYDSVEHGLGLLQLWNES